MPRKGRAPRLPARENIVGENIRALLKQQGRTVLDLAKAIGAHPKTVYFWTQGVNRPDSYSREKLCDYFQISEAQLFSPGLAVGTPAAEASAAHTLIVQLGLEGVTPEELQRLNESDKALVKNLIKSLAAKRSQRAQEMRPKGAAANRKTILIVDDEARLCQALQAQLKELGYRVRIAADGLEAFRRIAESTPDLIVLDLRMVGMDGLTFLRRLRQEDPATKVIVISAHADEIVNVHTENLKIEGFFDKPFPLEDLFEQIEKSIGGAT